MNRCFQVVVATVLSLLMTASTLAALPFPYKVVGGWVGFSRADIDHNVGPLVLVQAERAPDELRKLKKKGREGEAARSQGDRRKTTKAAKEHKKPRREREAVRSGDAGPKAPKATEQREEPRRKREAVKQREGAPKAPKATERREEPSRKGEAVQQRGAAPKTPKAADRREEPRRKREAVRQRKAEPKAPRAADRRQEPRREREAADKRERSDAATPVLDSAKEERQRPGRKADPAEALPPESDAAAQAGVEVDRREVKSLISQEGRRLERPRPMRDRVPEGAKIVRKVENRTIIEFNDTYIVERQRDERLSFGARDVYYEELPHDLQREVVIRPDGTRIITVYNRYGDVVRRVKIQPDGREVVLVYVDDRYYDDVLEWRDPGADLPPLLLTIPAEEYILNAALVEDPYAYYDFLEQPPVEVVERTYSLDEVRRSARIRDKVRRIDLDVINFAFGSSEIEESEIYKLEGVADAMLRLLEENPGEVFFIEGHTDAVGSDLANLALSDQRAEAVAVALTSVFDIPPENLEVQGYGEQYLKVHTQQRERENRRVAIRRITPLVAPVVSTH
ncbi:OmpA family protein [Chelativorans salis]|uniref:OmpA family protein n=1 Tax=Chelativorans salis TaxID=2978478 RepID=A0ABT2LUL2_9HYPH|nr:OmpA family protein [Chelativorans sp. EGI FJ00035]MCT7378221.1 OmpA family protein [Chelativorans sp. EGI FJ00035]